MLRKIAILCAALVTMTLAGCGYNDLQRQDEGIKAAWSEVLNQYQRRADLVPNLVNTVKGYAAHEQATFEKVIAARNVAMNAQAGEAKAKAENALSETLKSIFALAEAYPDLKANQNFLELQRELTDTEDKIQASRRFYNGNVRDFNTAIEVFPTNLIANMLGFKGREFFAADESEKDPVKVKF